MSDNVSESTSRAASQWRTEGWVLVEGLVPRATIEAARAEIVGRELDPTPAGMRRGPLRRPDERREASADSTPAFREEQFIGTTLFPIPRAPQLNRLFVHPRVVAFAQAALDEQDLRLYQSRLWSKFGDRADYEQPLHRDGNHSLVPTRAEPGYWFLEAFLYLDDVDHTNGAPRLVPRSRSSAEPDARRPTSRHEAPDLYDAEVSAAGPAGSLLAYRSDVWHRGTDIIEGAERHVLVIGFKPADLDWVGFDAHPPLVANPDFVQFAAQASPAELALFGVPRPGHPYWTPMSVDGLEEMYPGLDTEPWRAALD